MNKRVCVLQMAFLPYLLPPVGILIRHLAARGYVVTLVKARPRNRALPEENRPECRDEMIALRTRRLPKSRWIEPFVFLEFVLRSVFRALRVRPVLIVAVDVDTLLQGYLVSRVCGSKLVYYSLELYTERPGFEPKWFWRGLERTLINRADLVVACEPNRARVMQERYGARRLPLCILNVPEYTPPCRTDLLHRYLRQQGVAAARPKIVVYVGVVTPARCAEEIVEAARLLPDDTVIVLIGPCEEGYDIEGAIRARGVERRVFYYGRVPSVADLEPLTNSADLGLQLQHNCGLNTYYCAPCKLFQYMMAGLPVVASNFPGMIEVVEKNLVGICVDPTDPKAIADAINTILSNEELRATMAANALRLSKERFCYEVEGTKLLDAIDGLVSAARL